MIARRRAELGMSLREASTASEVPVATLSRVEQGRIPDLETFRRIVGWLGVPPEQFFTPTNHTESTPEVITEHLMADSALTREAADTIAGIVRELYQKLASPGGPTALHLRAAKTFTPPAQALLADLLEEMQAAVQRERPV